MHHYKMIVPMQKIKIINANPIFDKEKNQNYSTLQKLFMSYILNANGMKY